MRNHPLVDGSKRLGWTATLVFLDLNDHWVEVEDDPACDLVISVTEGRTTPDESARLMDQWRAD